MAVSHAIYFTGLQNPLTIDLKDDSLFRTFQRWLEKDKQIDCNGCVIRTEAGSIALNFHQIARMKIDAG